MSASVSAVCVDPAQVHRVWPTVAPWVERAMERGDLGTFEALQSDVLSGDALVWLVWNDPNIIGAAVTQVIDTECSTVCMVQACGGERAHDWVHLLSDIEIYAKDIGCDCVRVIGRKGWQRMLPDYRLSKVVLERRL